MSELWLYSFCLHSIVPNLPPAVRRVMDVTAHGRQEWVWTESEFNIVRDQLAQLGFEMHEITRTPDHPSEIVL